MGAGINFTNFSEVKFEPAVVTALWPNIERTSAGLALQAGFDYALGGGWQLNVDVKNVKMATDVSSAGKKVGTFTIDPLLVRVGVGLRL